MSEGEEDDDDEEESEQEMNADELEDKACEEFLSKFRIYSESTFLDNIDIILMLRALPGEVVSYNLE